MDSPTGADRLTDKIVSRCQTLVDHPKLGRLRPDIAPEARMLTIGNYLVLYRIIDPDVDIVRVVHGARQLEGLFDD